MIASHSWTRAARPSLAAASIGRRQAEPARSRYQTRQGQHSQHRQQQRQHRRRQWLMAATSHNGRLHLFAMNCTSARLRTPIMDNCISAGHPIPTWASHWIRLCDCKFTVCNTAAHRLCAISGSLFITKPITSHSHCKGALSCLPSSFTPLVAKGRPFGSHL